MIRSESIDRDELLRLLQPLADHLGVTMEEVYRLTITPQQVEVLVCEDDEEGRRAVSRQIESPLYAVVSLRITS